MFCPACKSALADELRYCLHCGQYLGEADETTRVAGKHAPPQTTIRAADWQSVIHDYEDAKAVPRFESVEKGSEPWALGSGVLIIGAILLLVIGAIIAWALLEQRNAPTTERNNNALARSSTSPSRQITPAVRQSDPTPLPTEQPTATPAEKRVVDRQLLLTEVMEVEDRLFKALPAADRATINEVLADEFRNVDPLGRVTTKADFVRNVRPSPLNIAGYDAEVLTVKGNTATITLTKSYYYPERPVRRTLDTDSFIWRDGRWQMTYSQSSYKP